MLVVRRGRGRRPEWDADWRRTLVANLASLVRELRQVGIDEVYVNGSFVEEKDHPNDIDGYFVCDREALLSGRLERELNRVSPVRIWTGENRARRQVAGHGWKLPMWLRYRVELYPHYGQGTGIVDRFGNELQFPSAFRLSRSGRLDLSKAEIRRGTAPLRTFHEQLREEVQSYERLRRGDKKELAGYSQLGQLLIALRIANGLSQRELAERLGVHESQVSRDERNDYHGVTVERANRIIEALGFKLRYSVSPSKPRPATEGRPAIAQ